MEGRENVKKKKSRGNKNVEDSGGDWGGNFLLSLFLVASPKVAEETQQSLCFLPPADLIQSLRAAGIFSLHVRHQPSAQMTAKFKAIILLISG